MQGIIFLLLGLFSSMTTALEDVSVTETTRLNTWLDARYEEELLANPMALTRLGRKESYGQIDDMSEAAALAEHQWMEQSVAQMQQEFEYDTLSDEGKISYDDALRHSDSANEVRLMIKLDEGGDAESLAKGLEGVEVLGDEY